jgi:uncharacterized protein (TIGR02466 family)
MKKAKKGRQRAAKPKGRRKQKQMPQAKARPTSAAATAETSPFGGSFDFTASAEPGALDLVTRAREELQGGRPSEALGLCRQALRADPTNGAALNLAGVAAFQSGQAQEALDMLETAIAFAPDNAETLTNYGNVLAALGRSAEAEKAYDNAVRADSRYPEAAFNRAVLLEATGGYGEALAAYEKTIEIAPIHTGARQGRANALKGLKRLDEARSAYEDVLRRDPSLAFARTNLAAVLQELGDFAGALEQCEKALEIAPDLTEARYNLAIALQELGRFEEAIEAYEAVLAAEPGHAAAALNIAYGLQQLGRLDEAGEAFDRTLAIDPDFAKAQVNLADLRLQQGNAQAAVEVCDAFLARHPASTDLLAMKALALSDLGDETGARKLIDFDRFLRSVRVSPPEDYADLDAFNAALSAHVESHLTLTFAPQSHATREGRHSGELLTEPKGPIAHLEKAILAAADAYREEMGRDADHPFLAAPPAKWTLSVWGVVMQSAGHQIPHIHPAAWLSGVYYAKLPDIVGAEDAGNAGWIEFGRPPDHCHNHTEPPVRSVRPEAGLMVLFPSYFYHHTVPFEAEGTRISIAFDLMPA